MFFRLPQDLIDTLEASAKRVKRDMFNVIEESFSQTLLCDPMFTMSAISAKKVEDSFKKAGVTKAQTHEQRIREVIKLGMEIKVDRRGNYFV